LELYRNFGTIRPGSYDYKKHTLAAGGKKGLHLKKLAADGEPLTVSVDDGASCGSGKVR